MQEAVMKINRLALATLFILNAGILLACTETSLPETPPTAEPRTATPTLPREEPSPLPSPPEVTPEPEQTPETTYQPEKQPAAPPHFSEGDVPPLDSVHMINTTDGWAIGGAYVFTTRDGGMTWKEVTPPQQVEEGSLAQVYGAFPDEETAWVIYGLDLANIGDPFYLQIPPEAVVWSTFNGGESWIASPPLMHEAYGDATWAELAAVDDATGWMMVRGVYVGAGIHYAAQLFQTVDGIAWIPIPNGDVGVDYTGMVFADEENGWLTWQTTGAYAAAPPEVARTTDGGYTWEVMELPPPDDAPDLFADYEYCEPYSPNLLSASSIRLLVACYGFSGPSNDTLRFIYRSDDAGDSWTIYPVPEMPNSTASTLIFTDEENSLLLGRDLLQSSDGGETWDLVKTVYWDGQFSFVDERNGWAIARNQEEIALVQTEDGGRTWSRLDPVVVR
jgi:hypothetical protein